MKLRQKLLFFFLVLFLGGRHAVAETSQGAKDETEKLLIAALPFAQQMLKKEGEFFPYGMVLESSGKIVNVDVFDGRERPSSNDIIRLLKERFVSGAKAGKYRATALVFDVRVVLPATEQQSDAIAVSLNHKSNYSVIVYFPYKLKDGALQFGDAFAQKGESDIFNAQR